MNQPGDLYPEPTRLNKYRYFFYEKHHRNGPSEDAQWLGQPELSRDNEFQVFDDADFHNIADTNGNLFCVRRKIDESVPTLGTRGEQVAQFPVNNSSTPWHGYPIWPILIRRDGDSLRPVEPDVLKIMVEANFIEQNEKRRLLKGKHI